jgi:hypothetical protein
VVDVVLEHGRLLADDAQQRLHRPRLAALEVAVLQERRQQPEQPVEAVLQGRG